MWVYKNILIKSSQSSNYTLAGKTSKFLKNLENGFVVHSQHLKLGFIQESK